MSEMNTLQQAVESCSNFEDGTEHLKFRDRYFKAFSNAMAQFFDLYHPMNCPDCTHLQYSEITFAKPQSMARFVGLLGRMVPAGSDQGELRNEPLVDLNFYGNKASILDCRLPAAELAVALKANSISCTVVVYHHYAIDFNDEQRVRHFRADCEYHGVKFDSESFRPPKFRLEPPKAMILASDEGISYNEETYLWDLLKHYDDHDYQIGPFDFKKDAVMASAQFDLLVSLIPAALEKRASKPLSSIDARSNRFQLATLRLPIRYPDLTGRGGNSSKSTKSNYLTLERGRWRLHRRLPQKRSMYGIPCHHKTITNSAADLGPPK